MPLLATSVSRGLSDVAERIKHILTECPPVHHSALYRLRIGLNPSSSTLQLGFGTVKAHTYRIYCKLIVLNRVGAVTKAYKTFPEKPYPH